MQRINAQPTFTDAAVTDLGGPRTIAFLERCEQLVDWNGMVTTIAPLFPEQPKGGRPFWPAVTMLKCVMLQKWFNLSDPQLEEQLRDRISFRRFVGLSFNDRTPGERGTEKYDGVSYATTVTFVNAKGLPPIPAGPPATPGK